MALELVSLPLELLEDELEALAVVLEELRPVELAFSFAWLILASLAKVEVDPPAPTVVVVVAQASAPVKTKGSDIKRPERFTGCSSSNSNGLKHHALRISPWLPGTSAGVVPVRCALADSNK